MTQHILAIDQGTSGSKAMVIASDGTILASATVSYGTDYRDDGFVEQDPRELYQSVISAVKETVRKYEESGYSRSGIAGAAISNQRESFVLWDSDGNPVTPVVVWQCKRSIAICSRMIADGFEDAVSHVTGLRIDPYFSGSKVTWFIEHDPEIKKRIRKGEILFGTIDTWLLHKLTGGRRYSTDYSNASRTLFFDVENLSWDAGMISLWGAEGLRLPEVCPSSHDFGTSDFEGIFPKGLVISAMIGDSHAACFGEGCFSPGTVKATMGTGSSVVMNTGKLVRSSHGMVTTVCWSTDSRVDYALEGVIVSCGSTVNWVQEKLGLVRDAKQFDEVAESVPDSGGVTFLPAFSGLGGPHWQMERRAEITGMTFGTTAAQIVRAAMESYPFQLKDVISAMEKDTGLKLKWIKADGGLTHSRISMETVSTLLGTEVRIDHRHQASSIGAAMLGFIGLGILDLGTVEQLSISAPHGIYVPGQQSQKLISSYEDWVRRIAIH